MNRTTRRAGPDRSSSALRAVVGCLLLALTFAAPAAAQMTRGAVSGTVRDTTAQSFPVPP